MAYTTIDDPSAYFQTALYTGNEDTNAITFSGNSDMQPDLVWVKDRTDTNWHTTFDSTRGVNKALYPSENDDEYTTTGGLTAFNSDGFTLGAHDNQNYDTNAFVSWNWKCNGGTTASNSDGSTTSTVQANTTAGFSIVTWTSAGATNVGHGLGVAPNLIIIKARNAAENWLVGSDEIVWTKRIRLNLDSASATSSAFGQAPTSSIFYCSPASSSYNYVAYCFAEKQGYSKFGSYTGNGNADGAFVHTGFKPAWIMIKQTNSTGSWTIHDTKRGAINPIDEDLFANLNSAESDNDVEKDILSNGFKLRASHSAVNGDGSTYIYMAFAESPFVSSKGVPCTAR
jgi:hypothetical protein